MMKRWTWAMAKTAGESHLASGDPCQDAIACDVVQHAGGHEMLIAAVADGAGSAEKANIGAMIAASVFVHTIRESLEDEPAQRADPDLIRHAVATARQSVQMFAHRQGREPSCYASTLIACVLDADGGLIAQIGDGAVVVASAKTPGVWFVPIWPDHGEYVNTTSFLTDFDATDKVRIARIDGPSAHVSLFTDGLERLVLDFAKREPHAPFFRAVFGELDQLRWQHGESQWTSRALRQLLLSPRVARRTDDDRSLLIASLREVSHGSG